MSGDKTVIRPARASDVPDLAVLGRQLGYEVADHDVAVRLEAVAGDPRHRVLVADLDGAIVGWVHGHETLVLQAPPAVEIGGLVVDERFRGLRVGARLVVAIEQWALERGFHTIRVRSRTTRHQAHAFYEQLGYDRIKSSYMFERELERP